MNAQQVVDKILSEAEQEGQKITDEAKQHVQSQKEDLNKQLDGYRAETAKLAEEAANDKTERMLATARMEIRKELMASKSELLNSVFSRAKERINSLGDDDYKKLMCQLMQKAVETGDEKVVTGKNDNRIDHGLIKEVNRNLGSGFKGNLGLSDEKAAIAGGFILKRGSVQINVSTDVLVDSVREDMEMEIAKELFEFEGQ
jgi:V/A-type H+-transporting ATPase subunit E